ncbi:MAG: zinc ABC transporter substrate-binding protein [Deltaproteobacteria bacterium]|nr:MAG: zinc ABC transporter substrate-binding protein [Deltaproteobacteria bacterium]
MKNTFFSGLLVLFVTTVGTAFAEPVKVFVSVMPQKYFVEKIGGDLLEVSVMVEPGASPATYEPKPRQMVALTKTEIYFAIGVPFEDAWLKKINAMNAGLLVVHTEAGIAKIPMKTQHHGGEGDRQQHEEKSSHHEEGHHVYHHHGIKDPHVWLSPPLVMLQARNILRALVRVHPEHRTIYERNYKNFIIELVVLDEQLRGVFADMRGQTEFMAFHPAWGYFARDYGLEQVPIEIEGKEPKPEELARLIRHAQQRGITVIFVQPQFSRQMAQTVAKAIGGQIVLADPLAPDWTNNLRQVAAQFKSALRGDR